jgi:3'(2'), 5'-bisphosphate nucleotidase
LGFPVADYSAQALVNTILSRAFPDDPIVGEEDAADLRQNSDSTAVLRSRIVELANEALTDGLGIGENAQWGLGPDQIRTEAELLDAIDRGTYAGGRTGRKP